MYGAAKRGHDVGTTVERAVASRSRWLSPTCRACTSSDAWCVSRPGTAARANLAHRRCGGPLRRADGFCTPWTRDAGGPVGTRHRGAGGGGRGVVTRRTREHPIERVVPARSRPRGAARGRGRARCGPRARVQRMERRPRRGFFRVHTLSLLSNKNQFTLCTGLQLQTTTQVISNPPPRPVESWPTPMPSAPRPTCRAAAAAARPFR